MIPRKEFQFENEFVRIINPGVELQKELGEKIKNEKDITTKISISTSKPIIIYSITITNNIIYYLIAN